MCSEQIIGLAAYLEKSYKCEAPYPVLIQYQKMLYIHFEASMVEVCYLYIYSQIRVTALLITAPNHIRRGLSRK